MKHFKFPPSSRKHRVGDAWELVPADRVPSAPPVSRIFLRLGGRLALGWDDLQWILYSPRQAAGPTFDAPLLAKDWVPIAFVSSTKAILEREIAESRVPLNDRGRLALERLPSSFQEWKAAQSAPAAVPAPVLAEAIDG